MTPDCDLLRRYVELRNEAAFAELVHRHMDLVYSVALRQANGNAHLARDVTQLVFLDLARKARALSQRATLAGWLHTSARFAASKAVRGEQRRQIHEQEAGAMHENTTEAPVNWEQLRPLLDEGVGQLDEADRDAIVLRFFQGMSHREVGAILGLNENSANKRIERALEKLRAHFARRGVMAPSLALAAAISENAVQAAPEGLVAGVAGASLAGAAGGAATGSVFLKILLMSAKAKLFFAAVTVLAVAVPVAISLNRTKTASVTGNGSPAFSASWVTPVAPLASNVGKSLPGNASSTAIAAPGASQLSTSGNSASSMSPSGGPEIALVPAANGAASSNTTATAGSVMGMHFAAEPANGSDLVRAYANRIRFGLRSPTRGTRADLTTALIRPVIPQFELSTDNITAGKGMESAEDSRSFLYVLEVSGTVVGYTAVQTDSTGAGKPVTNMSFGTFGAEVVGALDRVAAIPTVRAGSYEPRILNLPAMGAEMHGNLVIWLKSTAGGDDLVYLFSDSGGLQKAMFSGANGWQRNSLVAAGSFLRQIRPLVQQAMARPPLLPGAGG